VKALIPVAGIGTKLRPHTHTQPKAMVPVAGKPIIAHIVDSLLESGIRDLVFVIGYLGDKIESFIREQYGQKSGVRLAFVVQDPREGLAQAVWVSKEHLKNSPKLLIVLGDTIVKLDLDQFLRSNDHVVGVKKVDQPGLFGVAELNEDGTVKRLVEKPKIPKSNLALVGIYLINQPDELIKACGLLIQKQEINQGEYQLTDALMYMVNKGAVIRTYAVDNWFDCGRKENLLEANAILMSRPDFHNKPCKDHDNTIFIPPISIGEGCKISHSIIGPNVAIGEKTTISYSIIKDTIIGSYSALETAVLENSIVGNDSVLKGPNQSLNIGDNTEINFNNS
jgi:glucose-1-phosphate thymidylyltransferase